MSHREEWEHCTYQMLDTEGFLMLGVSLAEVWVSTVGLCSHGGGGKKIKMR